MPHPGGVDRIVVRPRVEACAKSTKYGTLAGRDDPWSPNLISTVATGDAEGYIIGGT